MATIRHIPTVSISMGSCPIQEGRNVKIERRSLERLAPDRPTQILIKLDDVVVGNIFNITTKGVAVEYPLHHGDKVRLDREVHIVLAINLQVALLVDEILCIPVYDIPTLSLNQTFQGVHMRLCGLRYVHKAQVNQTMLKHLLAAPVI